MIKIKPLRKKPNKIFIISASLAVLFIALVADIFFEVCFCRIRSVTIETDKIPSGSVLRIVEVSDIHNRMPLNIKWLSRQIDSFSPDFIALTGDVVDRSTVSFDNAVLFAKILRKSAPVFFVRGNHEIANRRGKEFIKSLSSAGVTILMNSSVRMDINYFSVLLAGIDDLNFGNPDLDAAEKDALSSDLVILLSHTPEVAEKDSVADIIISGHTHGGQVSLPFYGPIIIPDKGILPYMIRGLSEFSSGRFLYVDTGVGTSGIPVRLFNPSEISFIEVKGK